MSRFFIHRPVFAGVIAILIVLAGIVAGKLLAVAQYPEIAPPTVLVTTTYPGASAETLAKTVAAPIEEQLSGVERLSYFSSSASSTGALSITITFEPGTNVDQAVFNVNNRVQIALRVPAITFTFTYWPGRSCSFGFGNSARICTVPRLASTVEPAKLSLPAAG